MEEKKLAKQFHDTYERLAPQFGYETREDTKEFEEDSPNGKLMIAVCKEVMLKELDRAREEGRREVLEDMKKVWDNDNLGDAPKYGRAGAGLMKRWIRDDINERLSKLTTK